MSSGGRHGNRIVLALSAENVVQRRPNGYGECLACGQRGYLTHRLGSLWKPRKVGNGDLIHTFNCPVNRFVASQDPAFKSDKALAWRTMNRKKTK